MGHSLLWRTPECFKLFNLLSLQPDLTTPATRNGRTIDTDDPEVRALISRAWTTYKGIPWNVTEGCACPIARTARWHRPRLQPGASDNAFRTISDVSAYMSRTVATGE